jgi:hypothetical protein
MLSPQMETEKAALDFLFEEKNRRLLLLAYLVARARNANCSLMSLGYKLVIYYC